MSHPNVGNCVLGQGRITGSTASQFMVVLTLPSDVNYIEVFTLVCFTPISLVDVTLRRLCGNPTEFNLCSRLKPSSLKVQQI